jgi:peptidoglycan hydrolase-like protein with peptidoglycan-binding domain
MKRNTIVSLLVTALALGMQPARAQRPDRAQNPASESVSQVDKQVVRDVEVALDKAGYYVGNVDGEFTADTRNAVESFQRDSALPVTGTITPQVLKTLGIE